MFECFGSESITKRQTGRICFVRLGIKKVRIPLWYEENNVSLQKNW